MTPNCNFISIEILSHIHVNKTMKASYHNIINSPGSSFKVKLFEEKTFPVAWHFHPQYELTYMLSSSGVRYVGDSIESFKHGDLVLVGSNLPHSWKTVGKQKEQVRCIIIQWDDSFFGNWLNKEELEPIKNLLKLSPRGIKFDEEQSKQMEDDLIELFDLNPLDRLLSFIKTLQKLALSDNFKLLAGTSFTDSLTSKESERINLIYDYVRKNYLRQITLLEVSEIVSMSKEAFCRFFKRRFNKSFFEFVNEYKISLATKMLIDTDLSISEVGYKTGYNNLTFFYRQFNKFMQMPPSQFRLNYRRINPYQ